MCLSVEGISAATVTMLEIVRRYVGDEGAREEMGVCIDCGTIGSNFHMSAHTSKSGRFLRLTVSVLITSEIMAGKALNKKA